MRAFLGQFMNPSARELLFSDGWLHPVIQRFLKERGYPLPEISGPFIGFPVADLTDVLGDIPVRVLQLEQLLSNKVSRDLRFARAAWQILSYACSTTLNHALPPAMLEVGK